jgi:hypothetical protein
VRNAHLDNVVLLEGSLVLRDQGREVANAVVERNASREGNSLLSLHFVVKLGGGLLDQLVTESAELNNQFARLGFLDKLVEDVYIEMSREKILGATASNSQNSRNQREIARRTTMLPNNFRFA